MRILLRDIIAKISERGKEYYDDVVNRGVIRGDYLEIDNMAYMDLLKKYNPNKQHSTCRTCNGNLPSLPQQIVNAASAAGKALMSGITGHGIRASENTIQQRKNICFSCPNYLPDSKRCKLCGCYTEVKLTLKTESCPENRWASE